MKGIREILFRGKTQWGEWKYGYYYAKPILCQHFILDGENQWKVSGISVGQYTGLLDKNGVKIFEGDIIRCGSDDEYGVVRYADGAFEIVMDGVVATFHENYWANRCEVIGNNYDNPDLCPWI